MDTRGGGYYYLMAD